VIVTESAGINNDLTDEWNECSRFEVGVPIHRFVGSNPAGHGHL
jgi:hypothetical protein